MTSSGRLLRKMRKVMGAAVVSSSMFACSSQVSCAVIVEEKNGVWHVTGSGELGFYGLKDYTCYENQETWYRLVTSKYDKWVNWEGLVSPSQVIICYGITKINDKAFQGCGLESITIPSSVKEIGSGAFERCWKLKEINIPEGVTEICENTFHGCMALEKITIPSSVKKIGSGAFNFCWKLKEVNIPEGVTEIDEKAFTQCDSLERVTIPSSVKVIGGNAFASCKKLKEVKFVSRKPVLWFQHGVFRPSKTRPTTILKGVSKFIFTASSELIIENNAFGGCDALKEVHLPYCLVQYNDAFDFHTKVFDPYWKLFKD